MFLVLVVFVTLERDKRDSHLYTSHEILQLSFELLGIPNRRYHEMPEP